MQKLRGLEEKKVEKTSKNSSLPPSKEYKANQSKEEKTAKKRERNHQQGGRELNPNPDQIVVAHATACPHCGMEVGPEGQKLIGIYERIEMPAVKVIVTRVERHGGKCKCCQQSYEAAVPVGLEPGSPFGDSVAIMVSYLRYSQGISSEGAIANLVKRVKKQLKLPVASILEKLRSAVLVGSDETSARVNGKNQWEWVFQNEEVCLTQVGARK